MTPPAIVGCLLGTAVGDALGLPYEGLSPQRQRRLFPHLDRHHLVFGKGMVSDDTEHTCMVSQSLIVAAGNPDLFTRNLAGRLQWWLVRLPAGVGFATLRSIGKLWLGFSPHHSGVYSAGNGAAIVGGIIGTRVGKIGIPTDWLINLAEFPCNINYLEKLGSRLAVAILNERAHSNDRHNKQSPPSLPVYLVCLRNLFFLLVVIFHGFRRCLP